MPNTKSLLYIDDDQGLGRLVQKNLERSGFRVLHVPDGPAGIALLQRENFDVVALDHYMPGQDGLQTLAAIRALPSPPPVIYATGTNEGRVAVAALKAGAADYVTKDTTGEFPALLLAAAEAAIEAVRLRRASEKAAQELRESRDRFEALAAEREILLREVNHRVGNSLQLVASFLHMQANSAGHPDVKAALGEANSRVMAVAQVHRRLYGSQTITTIPLDDYLSGLLGDLSRSSEHTASADLLSLQAERIEVDADQAIALGMIVTELVINAFKYAYPDGTGPVRVVLKRTGPAEAALTVEDDGVGSASDTQLKGSGLGRIIVRAMAMKLKGDLVLSSRNPGLSATIVFALDSTPAPTEQ